MVLNGVLQKERGTSEELLGWREHLRKAFSDHLSRPFGNPEEGGLCLDLDRDGEQNGKESGIKREDN